MPSPPASAPPSTDAFYYPNKMGRIILQALEEVIGQSGVRAVLKLAGLPDLIDAYPPNTLERGFRFEAVSGILRALEEMYGPRGGRGLALRAGRACFKYGIKEFGPVVGISDLAFRMLPMGTKLKVGAEIFARVFNEYTDQRVRLEEEDQRILWIIERCPVCWERTSADAPVCHLAVGILQESLYWVSSGKIFAVEETTCIALGDPTCTIAIPKQPIS